MDSHIKGAFADQKYGAVVAQVIIDTGTTPKSVKFHATTEEPVIAEYRTVGGGTAPTVDSTELGLTDGAVGSGGWTIAYMTQTTTLTFTGAGAGKVAVRFAGRGVNYQL